MAINAEKVFVVPFLIIGNNGTYPLFYKGGSFPGKEINPNNGDKNQKPDQKNRQYPVPFPEIIVLHTAYERQDLGNVNNVEDDRIKQKGDIFGPETIGGKNTDDYSQCQYRKPMDVTSL